MHQPMFDGHFQHGDQLRMAFFGPRQGMLDGVVQFIAQTTVVALHFLARRPILRSIRWQSPIDGVNAKRKQVIECALKRS